MTTKHRGAQLDHDIDEVLAARKRREARQVKQVGAAKPSTVPSQAEYESRELREAQSKLGEVSRAPLADRKEAQAEFLAAMRDHPEIVAERVGWLLAGNYGYGSKLLADRVFSSPRMNRSAALTQMVAAFEWQCPEDMARAAWKKLSPTAQAHLERVVRNEIKDAESA